MATRILAATFLVCSPPVCAAQLPDRTEAVTSIPEIRNLSKSQARAGRPVHLEGMISYVDPIWKFLFLQDGNDGVFVHGVVEHQSLECGQMVRIQGKTGFEFCPLVRCQEPVEVLGDFDFPTPIPITSLPTIATDQLNANPFESRLVSVELRLRQATIVGDRVVYFGRFSGQNLFVSVMTRSPIAVIDQHVGTTVRVTGVLGYKVPLSALRDPSAHSAEPEIYGYQLFVRDSKDLRVVSHLHRFAEVGRTNVPTTSQLGQLSASSETNPRRSYYHAQVTLVEDDFLVAEADGARRLRIKTDADLAVGQTIQVAVSRSPREDGFFAARTLRVLTPSPLTRPPIRSADEIAKGRFWHQRVSVSGTIVGRESDERRTRFLLRDDSLEFYVDVPCNLSRRRLPRNASVNVSAESDSRNLESARELIVSGVAFDNAELSDQIAFRVVTGQPRDLRVTRRYPSYIPMLVLAAVAGVGAVLSSVWIRSLRFHVGEQTRALATANAQLRTSWNAIDDAIIVTDGSNQVLASNRSVGRFFGIRPSPGEDVSGLMSVIARCAVQPAIFEKCLVEIADDPGVRRSWRLDVETDELRNLLVRTAPIRSADRLGSIDGRLWLFEDETEKQSLESHLRHAQKMEAVGTLAGGIAHDFNNFLAVIATNLAILRGEIGPELSVADESLSAADQAVFRAASVVRKLLTFSRKKTLKTDTRSPNALVNDAQPMLRSFFDASIRFELDLADNVPHVNVDATLIEQVLVNLCLNARDAMPRGGTISIRTRSTASDVFSSADAAIIEVEDTGCGMCEEIRDQIFDPFFTTKSPEQGTGLGLAMSYAIVEQHHGILECESQLQSGTIFRIRLPGSHQPKISDRVQRSTEELRGPERVLLSRTMLQFARQPNRC